MKIEKLKQKAEAGDAEAQYDLAIKYENGEDVRKSDKQALAWYKKSAKQGYSVAQSALGRLYRDGQGVERDVEKALYWYREAAEQGDAWDQRQLAETLVDENPEESIFWYHKAAEQDDEDAMFALAELYEEGKGTPKNDCEAFKLFLRSAQLGKLNAYYEVGRCYAAGQGTKKNAEEAVRWLRHVADPRTTIFPWKMSAAQLQMSVVFTDPEHNSVDPVEAYKWLSLAATYAPSGQEFFGAISHESLSEAREIFAQRLTKAQLDEAQRRSAELFVPRNKIDKRLHIN